ncbi:glutamate receptor ionotropic, kainate glr-3-like [Daphnia pulex]|uniref:glutamate receptor ionotropic, kainate glr-3-like n=1 Tax=Daphnia pulex TaxID=6669 RepID=UPI001EDF6036|nr:glutamate receptor ionotropic, kainate glr-3-like [Daphnia pulex]
MTERPPHFMARNTTLTNNRTFHGSWADAIEWLSRRLNFSYKIIQSKEAWGETSGRLQREEFDVVGPPVVMMLGRIRLFDYVGVFEDETSALLTPALTEESSLLSTIKPFQPTVWLVMLMSLLTVAIYFSASSTLNLDSSDRNAKSLNIGDYVLYTTAILINQGPVFWQSYGQSKLSFRLAAGVWCLFALVMVNVYSGTLTAHITARKMSVPPGDSIEVMEQGILPYLVVTDGLGREIILVTVLVNGKDFAVIHSLIFFIWEQSATSGPLKKMGDIFRRHPEYFIPDQETGFQKAASGCCAYTDLVNYLKFRIGKDFQETGKCRVHIGKPIRGYGFSGLILKKKSLRRNSLNQGILELYQTGLVEHWRNEYFLGNSSPCESAKNKSKILRRLNLKDLASAFFILGIGALISLLAFSIEQFRRFKTRQTP